MRKLFFITITLIICVAGFNAGVSTAQAQECSAEFPNGTCPAEQHCQVVGLREDNEGEYACVDDLSADDCGSNPSICPAGTQCVSSGGFFDCVPAVCQEPDPTNTAQTCTCAEVGGNFVWQCNLRTNASSGDYVCYDFVDGQCVNWIQQSSGTGSRPGNLTYVPLEPLPGVPQGGEANFADLVKGFFRLLVNLAAFVAVTVLVIGGITYMVSEATVTKFVAKEKIKAAFWGLAIIAAAWLILNTINPQLLTFNRDFLNPTNSVPATQNSSSGSNNTPPTPTINNDGSVKIYGSLPHSQQQKASEEFITTCTEDGGKVKAVRGRDSRGAYGQLRCIK